MLAVTVRRLEEMGMELAFDGKKTMAKECVARNLDSTMTKS